MNDFSKCLKSIGHIKSLNNFLLLHVGEEDTVENVAVQLNPDQALFLCCGFARPHIDVSINPADIGIILSKMIATYDSFSVSLFERGMDALLSISGYFGEVRRKTILFDISNKLSYYKHNDRFVNKIEPLMSVILEKSDSTNFQMNGYDISVGIIGIPKTIAKDENVIIKSKKESTMNSNLVTFCKFINSIESSKALIGNGMNGINGINIIDGSIESLLNDFVENKNKVYKDKSSITNFYCIGLSFRDSSWFEAGYSLQLKKIERKDIQLQLESNVNDDVYDKKFQHIEIQTDSITKINDNKTIKLHGKTMTNVVLFNTSDNQQDYIQICFDTALKRIFFIKNGDQEKRIGQARIHNTVDGFDKGFHWLDCKNYCYLLYFDSFADNHQFGFKL